jgi:hypothetical protein
VQLQAAGADQLVLDQCPEQGEVGIGDQPVQGLHLADGRDGVPVAERVPLRLVADVNPLLQQRVVAERIDAHDPYVTHRSTMTDGRPAPQSL